MRCLWIGLRRGLRIELRRGLRIVRLWGLRIVRSLLRGVLWLRLWWMWLRRMWLRRVQRRRLQVQLQGCWRSHSHVHGMSTLNAS